MAATNDYFDQRAYRNGIRTLEHRWIKCTELGRNYIEKLYY